GNKSRHYGDVDMNGHGGENKPTMGQKGKQRMSVMEGDRKRKVMDPVRSVAILYYLGGLAHSFIWCIRKQKGFNPVLQYKIQVFQEAVAEG
ncbi:hypothetical protein H0H92_010921, partial [Tricholoma furcatifolium]